MFLALIISFMLGDSWWTNNRQISFFFFLIDHATPIEDPTVARRRKKFWRRNIKKKFDESHTYLLFLLDEIVNVDSRHEFIISFFPSRTVSPECSFSLPKFVLNYICPAFFFFYYNTIYAQLTVINSG